MERSHGEEGVEGKCRKDKCPDLWYRPGPLAEFRGIPTTLRRLWEPPRTGGSLSRPRESDQTYQNIRGTKDA